MKLSEMTNKEAMRVTIKLLPIIKNIITDRELLKIWYKEIKLELGMTEQEIKLEKGLYATEKILDLVPYVVENHESDMYKLLSILNNKSVEEVENQSFAETIAQITESLNDEGLAKLFTM